MEEVHTPLCPLLSEINKAVANGLPFLAVAMTVALPDICVSLASADGRTDRDGYKEWCQNNLGPEFGALTPDDLYAMRCGVLHNGRFGNLPHNYARVVFALPDASQNTFIACASGDAYLYSVIEFCGNFTKTVHTWMNTHVNDQLVQFHLPNLMQYRVGGFPPYINGAMVLA